MSDGRSRSLFRGDAPAVCAGPAEQRLRVSYPPHLVVQVRQVFHAGQRVRVVEPEDPLRIRAALLGELYCGWHPSGRVISGGQASAGRHRIWMSAPEDLLAVAQHPLVVRYGVPYFAFGPVGRGESVPGGHGLHIAGTL